LLFDSVITADPKPIMAMDLRSIRIGVPRGFFYDNLDAELALVVESALAKLRDSGCVVVEADVPDV